MSVLDQKVDPACAYFQLCITYTSGSVTHLANCAPRGHGMPIPTPGTAQKPKPKSKRKELPKPNPKRRRWL